MNIHCIENPFIVHDFWATCACPEKTEFPLKIFTVLNIFFTIQDFWATLCLPWKPELPWNLSLYWIYFLLSGVLSNLHALALRNRGCPEFTVLIIYFLSFRIFEQLALALQNRVAPVGFPWFGNLLLRFGVLPSVDLACEESCRCIQRCWFPQTLPTRQPSRCMSIVLTPDYNCLTF